MHIHKQGCLIQIEAYRGFSNSHETGCEFRQPKDITKLPILTFSFVEQYIADEHKSYGVNHMTKG